MSPPVVLFKRVEEVLDHMKDLLDTNSPVLGLKHVGYGTENLVPTYPACIVSSGDTRRELHATRQFLVRFEINFWVYHATLAEGHPLRTKDDLKLVTDIVELLHSDYTLDDRLVFGFVLSEEPGIAQTRRSAAVVSTRIVWTGESRVPFNVS